MKRTERLIVIHIHNDAENCKIPKVENVNLKHITSNRRTWQERHVQMKLQWKPTYVNVRKLK